MIKKPTSGDSEQREHEAERARKSSSLSASSLPNPKTAERRNSSRQPAHGSSEGESAHGAIPRQGIEFEQGD